MFLAILSRSSFDHHLRCVGWLNFEFSKREKHSGWAIKSIYKKLNRGMLDEFKFWRWFRGRVVCALDYEAGDPGSIPGSGGTTDWLFSAGWYPNRVLLPAVSA